MLSLLTAESAFALLDIPPTPPPLIYHDGIRTILEKSRRSAGKTAFLAPIVEFVGASASGKTTIVCEHTMRAIMPPHVHGHGEGVLVICCADDGLHFQRRLQEMMETWLLRCAISDLQDRRDIIDESLERLVIRRITPRAGVLGILSILELSSSIQIPNAIVRTIVIADFAALWFNQKVAESLSHENFPLLRQLSMKLRRISEGLKTRILITRWDLFPERKSNKDYMPMFWRQLANYRIWLQNPNCNITPSARPTPIASSYKVDTPYEERYTNRILIVEDQKMKTVEAEIQIGGIAL